MRSFLITILVLTILLPTSACQPSCQAQVADYITKVQPLVAEFQDAIKVATATPRIALSSVISNMQKVRRDIVAIPVPECAQSASKTWVDGLDKVINGFTEFMADSPSSVIRDDFGQGSIGMADGFDQLTALASGKPVPTPNEQVPNEIYATLEANLNTDPVSVVKEVIAAITGKQFDKLADFACAAKKSEVQNQFNPAAALAAQGMNNNDVQKLLDSMTISFDNPQFGAPTVNGDAASVPMQGKLAIKLDKDKLKAFVSSALQEQGVTKPTDAQINQVLDLISSQLEQGQDISTTVDMIKENGKWVICPKN